MRKPRFSRQLARTVAAATLFGISACGDAPSFTEVTDAPSSAPLTLAPPLAFDRVLPDIGPANDPTVIIEPIRRTTGDAYLLNFDVFVRNTGSSVIELDQIRRSYPNTPNPPSTNTFQAREVASWLGEGSRAFGFDGSVAKRVPGVATNSTMSIRDVAIAGDRHVMVGSVTEPGQVQSFAILRANRHGEPDGWTRVFPLVTPGEARVVRTQSTTGGVQMAIAAGWAIHVQSGRQHAAIARYFVSDPSTGQLAPDNSFSSNGRNDVDIPGCEGEVITALQVLPGSKYLAAGTTTCGAQTQYFLMRFNSDGSLDAGFATGGILLAPNPFPTGLAVEGLETATESGQVKAYVLLTTGFGCSLSSEVPTGCQPAVAKHLANGSVDSNWAGGGWALFNFPSAAGARMKGLYATAGLVTMAGTTVDTSGNVHAGVARLLASGSIDTTFGSQGTARLRAGLHDTWAIGLRPEGDQPTSASRIIVGGYTKQGSLTNVVAIRWSSNGKGTPTWDQSYQTAGQTVLPASLAVVNSGDPRIVVGGALGDLPHLVQFRYSDMRLDWRGLLDPDETVPVFWPETRELAATPLFARIELRVTNNSTWAGRTYRVGARGSSQNFPTLAGAVLLNETWATGGHHELGAGHRYANDQRYAYDFGMYRWTGSRWVVSISGTDHPTTNQDHVIWGKPVHATASGSVVRCWRNALNNPAPGQLHPAFLAGNIPGGGNLLYIRNDADGTLSVYAHFQEYSVPTSVCPNTCVEWVDDVNRPWLNQSPIPMQKCSHYLGTGPEDQPDPVHRPHVNAGQFLGFAGNSGNSSAPHLHFAVQTSKDDTSAGAPNTGIPVLFRNTTTQLKESQLTHNPLPPSTPDVALNGTTAPGPGTTFPESLLMPTAILTP